jgi:hypothetical protein
VLSTNWGEVRIFDAVQCVDKAFSAVHCMQCRAVCVF